MDVGISTTKDSHTTSRLGKILLDKGMISHEQLDIAIDEQNKRRQYQDSTDPPDTQSTALGEILIELGFISRLQLKRGLTWQLILRNMTIALSLCAPLMTLGANATSSAPTRPGTSYSSSATSMTSSSAVSISSARPANSSQPASASSSSITAEATSVSSVAGPVFLQWVLPNQRENGDYLDITEVGGYELRYRKINDPDFIYMTINNAWATRYYFRWLEGAYEFQIAVFDKNGLYSQFVRLMPD